MYFFIWAWHKVRLKDKKATSSGRYQSLSYNLIFFVEVFSFSGYLAPLINTDCGYQSSKELVLTAECRQGGSHVKH